MKRFLVFGGEDYYPHGGWGDFIDSFDTIEEAKSCAQQRFGLGELKLASSEMCSVTCRKHNIPALCRPHSLDWAQVVDSMTGKVIELRFIDDFCPVCQEEPSFPEWKEAA